MRQAFAGELPRVQAVVLNVDRTADTLECLESISRVRYANLQVLVVDNGSAESCRDAVATRFPSVEVFESGSNLGCAGGNNVGLRTALRNKAEFVWLVDNDCVVHPDTLRALVDTALRDGRAGIVGSKTLFHHLGSIIDHAGGVFSPARGTARHIGCGERDVGQHDRAAGVDYVTGCSLLARTTMVREIGLLDEALFVYWEDVDWCIRAHRHDWRVIYAPAAVVRHKGGTPTRPSLAQRYLDARNSLRVVAKHHPGLLGAALFWWTVTRILDPVLNARFDLLRVNLAALRDWVAGRGGPPRDFPDRRRAPAATREHLSWQAR